MPMQMAFFFLFIAISGAQNGASEGAARLQKLTEHLYRNGDLGFTYMPPAGLREMTDQSKAEASANRPGDKLSFEPLLQMSSGPDDQAVDWMVLGVTTYPRGRDKDKSDDITAGFFTNYAVGGGITSKREVLKIAERDFSVSYFEKKDPPLTRYGIAYTVVHKEKFLTFFFAGNDLERVQKMAKSMDTLKFQP